MAFIPKTGITNGSIIDTTHITNIIQSLDGTGSYEINATGSFSGSGQIASASFATTSSYAVSSSLSVSSSYALSASYSVSSSQAISSSFATTASFAANANVFPYTGSARITGSLGITGGPLEVVGTTRLTGSLLLSGSTSILGSAAATYTADVFNISLTAANNLELFSGNISIGSVVADNLRIIGTLSSTTVVEADPAAVVNLSQLGNSGNGYLIIPITQTGYGTPDRGTIYWDDNTSTLNIYSSAASAWLTASFG